MILENRNVIINESDGESLSSSEMRISSHVHGHIISMLTERTYKDPIGSLVRELSSNAVDSHRVAGNDSPVVVSLDRNAFYKYELRIIDEGIGLNEEDFYKFIGGVGESDKQNTNDLIGCYGLGSKSPLSYCDSYSFICRKDGIERRFTIIKSNPLPKLEKVYEKETEEKNGVTVIVPIKDGDAYNVTCKMKEQLAYFPNVVFDNKVYSIKNDFSIYRDKEFQWSELCSDSYMHLTLDDVYYPLSFSSLGISSITLPVALKFALSDGLFPIPNREEIIYNEETKKLIKDKIKRVCTWFIEKYNNSLVPYKDFVTIFPLIGQSDKSVIVNEKSFSINNILQYSDIDADEITMEGVSLRKLGFYKSQWTSMLEEYESFGFLNWKGSWGKLTKAPYPVAQILKHHSKVVEIHPDEPFTGKWKKYLKYKYESNTLFVKKKNFENLAYYHRILSLHGIPKEKWRDYIKEFQYIQDTVKSHIIQELDSTSIPKSWLDSEALSNKARYEKGAYARLNKQVGDITLSVGRLSRRGGITFDKEAAPIASLHKRSALHIYFNDKEAEEQEDLLDELANTIFSNDLIHPKLKIVVISRREIKKLPKIHNFVTMDEFKKTKPFARMVTSYLISEALDRVPQNNWKLVKECNKGLEELIVKLKDYQNKYYIYEVGKKVMKKLLPVAEQYNLYDHEVYSDYLKLKKAVTDFAFVDTFTGYKPDIEKNVIYTVMLFKKLHRNMFDDYELVKKSPVVEEVKAEGEVEIEDEFNVEGEITEDDLEKGELEFVGELELEDSPF